MSSTTRVIIDTDPGVDDALAILLALSSPELDVVGITTVCGNVPVGQATKNLFRVLNLVQPPSELLVGQGAARPLEHQLVDATHFHGHDGLGELDRFRDGGQQAVIPSRVFRRLCRPRKRSGMNVPDDIPGSWS